VQVVVWVRGVIAVRILVFVWTAPRPPPSDTVSRVLETLRQMGDKPGAWDAKQNECTN
jgi:hypothetical protein